MINTRRRILTIVLAAGGLTMFGAGGALAAAPHAQSAHPAVVTHSQGGTQADPPEGGEAPGPTHPFCEGGSPLLGSPFCPSKWPPS
jgi:hypothetical protein